MTAEILINKQTLLAKINNIIYIYIYVFVFLCVTDANDIYIYVV